MTKNIIPSKPLAVRYLFGLGIFVLLGAAYVAGITKLNKDLVSVTLFGNHVMKMNLVAEELHSNALLIDNETSPQIRRNIALSSLIIAKQFDYLNYIADDLFRKLSTDSRIAIISSNAFGENYIWPYNRINQIADEMEVVRDLERRGAPIIVTESSGLTYSITETEPLVVMANKVASPYANFVQDARKEQRVFLHEQTLSHINKSEHFTRAFSIASLLALSFTGWLVFFPMLNLFSEKKLKPVTAT